MAEQPCIAYCLSYVPLLRGQAGVDLSEEVRLNPEQLRQILFPTITGLAIACLWVMQDGELIPVLVYDRGTDINAHLLEWTENDPPGWFTLHVAELPNDPPGYLVVLQPRIDRSVERFKRAFPPGFLDKATIEVIFSPLYCIVTGTSYQNLKSKIGPASRLGILDAKDFNPNRPGDLDLHRVQMLGPFIVGDMTEQGGVEAFLCCAGRLLR